MDRFANGINGEWKAISRWTTLKEATRDRNDSNIYGDLEILKVNSRLKSIELYVGKNKFIDLQ